LPFSWDPNQNFIPPRDDHRADRDRQKWVLHPQKAHLDMPFHRHFLRIKSCLLSSGLMIAFPIIHDC
jgi:hypothetical protein